MKNFIKGVEGVVLLGGIVLIFIIVSSIIALLWD